MKTGNPNTSKTIKQILVNKIFLTLDVNTLNFETTLSSATSNVVGALHPPSKPAFVPHVTKKGTERTKRAQGLLDWFAYLWGSDTVCWCPVLCFTSASSPEGELMVSCFWQYHLPCVFGVRSPNEDNKRVKNKPCHLDYPILFSWA